MSIEPVEPMEGLWTTPQAAKYLGIKPQTLRRARMAGTSPRYMRMGKALGGRCLYDPRDLRGWVEARKFGSTAEEAAKQAMKEAAAKKGSAA